MNNTNEALNAEKKYKTSVEEAQEYIENFDILETINNVGNDEVFTPVKVCQKMLDLLPNEIWHNPNYKWLNPCDKNGVFLREIALRLDSGLIEWETDIEKRRKHILQNMIYSIGLTKFTSQVSRRTVYYCSQANRRFDGQVDQDGNSINGYAIGNGDWFNTEQGNILNPITEHTFIKGKCIYCRTAEKDKDGNPGRYSDPKQLEHYAYEFIHAEDIEKHLQDRFFGGKKMKFDIIIGNPPYQLSDRGDNNSASPLYHTFVEQAKKLNPRYLSMIIPSRWMAGGKGLDKFRESMLNDRHITKIVDYINAKDCFPNSSIASGVCYFLWDSSANSTECVISNIYSGNTNTQSRNLNQFPVLVRYNEAINVINKVLKKDINSFSKIISSRNFFGFPSDTSGRTSMTSNDCTLYSSKGVFYVDRSEVSQNIDFVDLYKVMISKTTSEHAGEPDKNGQFKVLSQVKVLKPNEICTDSYLITIKCNTEIESQNIVEFLKSKFARFLFMQSLTSVSISRDTFRFVPILDFTKKWTDKDLYLRYELDQEDIDFIENMIKEM